MPQREHRLGFRDRWEDGRRALLIAVAASCAALSVAIIAPNAGGNHHPDHRPCNDQQANVEVGVTAAPDAPYSVGQTVTLTVRAENLGPCPAPQAEITLTIPSGLTPGAATPTDGTYDSLFRRWTVNLGKDASNPPVETLELSVTINSAGPHTATASLTDGQFDDPESGNDEESVTLTTGTSTSTSTSTSTGTTTTTTDTGATTTTTQAGTTITDTGTTTTSQPPSNPIEGKKINAEETTGEVIVKLPGQDPRPINPEGELLPPGTKIDATNGTVQLTSEYNGKFEQGTFWGGALKLDQGDGDHPVTVAKLVGGFGSKAASAGKKGKKRGGKKRRLWGQANKGHFRTTGRSGSATVRGTKWKTVDKPNGKTKLVLKRGKLWINDYSKRGKVDKILKGSGKYIADPKVPTKKKTKKRR